MGYLTQCQGFVRCSLVWWPHLSAIDDAQPGICLSRLPRTDPPSQPSPKPQTNISASSAACSGLCGSSLVFGWAALWRGFAVVARARAYRMILKLPMWVRRYRVSFRGCPRTCRSYIFVTHTHASVQFVSLCCDPSTNTGLLMGAGYVSPHHFQAGGRIRFVSACRPVVYNISMALPVTHAWRCMCGRCCGNRGKIINSNIEIIVLV